MHPRRARSTRRVGRNPLGEHRHIHSAVSQRCRTCTRCPRRSADAALGWIEWRIDGDANRNAAVAVTYRKRGDNDWRKGLPLLRIGGDRTVFEGALDYTAPERAGSLFNLTENSEYEVQFALSDPDGVSVADSKGTLTKSVSLRTRAEPQAPTAGRTFHVYPGTTDGFQGAHPPLR